MPPTADAGQGRNQRRLSNYLIDRRFQLKYSMLAVVGSVIIACVLGALLYQARSEASTLLRDQLISLQPSAELSGLINQTLEEDRGKTLWTLVAAMAGFVLVLTLFGIYYTHKVAGPLFAISRYIDDITEGRLSDVRPLRKGDELQGFFVTFNSMLKTLQQRERDDLAVIDELLAAKDLPAADRQKLETLREKKKERLG
jgi:hypothetical protein